MDKDESWILYIYTNDLGYTTQTWHAIEQQEQKTIHQTTHFTRKDHKRTIEWHKNITTRKKEQMSDVENIVKVYTDTGNDVN